MKAPSGVPTQGNNPGLPTTIKKIKVVNTAAAKTLDPGKNDAGGDGESDAARMHAEKKKAEIIDYVHKR